MQDQQRAGRAGKRLRKKEEWGKALEIEKLGRNRDMEKRKSETTKELELK